MEETRGKRCMARIRWMREKRKKKGRESAVSERGRFRDSGGEEVARFFPKSDEKCKE